MRVDRPLTMKQCYRSHRHESTSNLIRTCVDGHQDENMPILEDTHARVDGSKQTAATEMGSMVKQTLCVNVSMFLLDFWTRSSF